MSSQTGTGELQPKLPAIGETLNLVSQAGGGHFGEQRNARDKRSSILMCAAKSEELQDDDVCLLLKQISRSFIAALQQNTKPYWKHLHEVLKVIKPYVHLLQGAPQIIHYVERTYHKMIDDLSEDDELTELMQTISLVFPEEFSRVQERAHLNKANFSGQSSMESLFGVKGRGSPLQKGVRVPRGEAQFSEGAAYILNQSDGDMKHFAPRSLCLEDLKRCLPGVVREIAIREATLGSSLGTTALALDIDLPQTHVPTPPVTPRRSPSLPMIRTPISGTDRNVPEGDALKEMLAKTGREVVEDFVKGRFLGEMKFAFLNIAPSLRYDPYNLVVVPENKVNSEHFVISSHCVLHVNPKGPAESQSLAEWHREACLFKAISNVGFFKSFLLIKMFRKWKDIKKFSHFLKVEAEIEKSLIPNTPSFGSALLRIFGLLQDLAKVTFLPFDVNMIYGIEEFESTVFKTWETGNSYLEKFFNYCQLIVEKTQESCFDYLEYCEAQVKNHRHNYEESLSVAKRKRTIRLNNLKLAREEVKRLGAFVRLVDHIIVSNLLALVQVNILKFVDESLPGPRPEREGFFSANMVFDDNHKVTLSPSSESFAYSMSFALGRVISACCNLSQAMELGNKAEEFSEKAEIMTSQKPNNQESNISVRHDFDKKRVPRSEIETLLFSGKHSVGEVPREAYHLSAMIGQSEVQSNDSDSLVGSTTRTDDEIHQDLETLNSELTSARKMIQQASKELCFHREQEGELIVEGNRFQNFAVDRSPLTKEKMLDTLHNNELIEGALKRQSECLKEAADEVQQFSDEHSWLTEIHYFVSMWGNDSIDSWRGQPPVKIEKQLNQIKTWSNQVSSMIKGFSTRNGLFFVECRSIQVALLPRLNSIFKEFVEMVATDVIRFSDELTRDVDNLSQLIIEEKTDISGFADFMQRLASVKERVPNLMEKVEYIKNLYEVIRSCFRQLSPEEEMAEEKVWATWEAFLFGLQQASDFVDIHKPVVGEKLSGTIHALEQNAKDIGHSATSGQFLDPNENPMSTLKAMRELKEKFLSIRAKLFELGRCQAVILRRPYDMTHINEMLDAIDKRQELWKYCEVTSNAIREWLQTVFKKMNVKKAIEKLSEWTVAGEKLKHHIPTSDEVLLSWLNQVEEFSHDLPLLLQLSSDALKPRHWRALFIGMGQGYDPSWQFTVADLLSLDLGRYKDLITTICSGAAAEYALEIQLNQLAQAWQEKDFKLAKHIPLMRPRMGRDQKNSAQGTKKTRHRAGAERVHVKVKPKTPSSVPEIFVLIGVGELKCIIEDNLVTLHVMLNSPHVADLKPLVETWITNLQGVEDITDVWAECQKKWLYLSNVFAEPQLRKSFANSIQKFTDIDTKYREFVQVMLREPKVLSVLSKKRGEKGYRELQGESMRSLLLDIIRKEEELIRLVDVYIEQARKAFPRLFFLSDNDLLGLLAWSRNPKDLVVYVRKCFPGVKNLQFTLPRDPSLRMVSSLDAALNAHLLEVTALEGVLGEVVPLLSVIPASPRPQGWLVTLEKRMRDTLVYCLAQCIERRLGGRESLVERLDPMISLGAKALSKEATGPSSMRQVSKSEQIDPLFDHIVWKFPSQCVITSEAIIWSRTMVEALRSRNIQSLLQLRTSLGSYVNDLSSAIRKTMELKDSSSVHGRLEVLLGTLVAMTIHQRDIVTTFIKNEILDVNSFEWQSQLSHHMDIDGLLGSSCPGESKRSSTIPIHHGYQIELCKVQQLGNRFAYGYEYLGPTPRLVVTPLTQRCFMTLTLALTSHMCGVPLGPDGMGKTETIKDLSKALGRHLVMFNCSEQLTSAMLVRYLFGMIQAGSWACFENVDCVNLGVLSVFGEHLATIRMSLKCLEKVVHTQYTAKGIATVDKKTIGYQKRRNSVTTLISLAKEALQFSGNSDSTWRSHVVKRKRHFSASRASDLEEVGGYYAVEDASPQTPGESSFLPKTSEVKTTKPLAKPTDWKGFEMPFVGHIVLEGQFMAASAMYGCFMTMSSNCLLGKTDMPENFRVQLRPVSMLLPDCLAVLEVWLLCSGFTEAKVLSQKMDIFFKLASEQVSSQPQYSFGLRSMKTVTTLAGKQLHKAMEKKRPAAMSSVREDVAADSETAAAPESKTRSVFLENLERRQAEENAVVHSLFTFFGNKLLAEDKETFSRAVDEVFAHSVLMSVSSDGDAVLVEEVREHLQANGLQVRQDMVTKILQLYTSLQTCRNVILLGSPGSGKTTVYKTLSSALNRLNNQAAQRMVKVRRQTVAQRRISNSARSPNTPVQESNDVLWPRVDLTVLFPKCLTCEELFGARDPENNLWIDGLVSKWLRDSTLTCDTMSELLASQSTEKQRLARMFGSLSHVKKWMALDGPMDSTWLENMGTLLDSTKALNLPNGESISQPDTVTLLFEVTDVAQVSPALVTRCGLVHCPDNVVGWKSIFRSWIKGAHAKWDITNRGLAIVSCLMEHTVDVTLNFLSRYCQPALTKGYGASYNVSTTVPGVHEVQTLLHYLSAIFDRHILREDDESQIQINNQKHRQSLSSVSSRQSSGISASDTGKVVSTYAFAFVWAFGGHLHESCVVKFDEHARELLSSGPYPVLVPPEGLVYDYFLDFNKGGLVKWEERPGIQLKTLASSYAIVREMDRYSYLVDLMISAGQPVLLVGPSGVGKSSLVQNLINPRYNSTRLCLSTGFTAKLLQEAVEFRLQQINQRERSQLVVQQSLGSGAPRNLPNIKGRQQLMFLDDLNCAGADAFGVQPPLELFRQILSQGTLFDKQKKHLYRVQHLQFLAACVPPGARTSCGGVACHPVSPRLTRLMTVLSFFPFPSESLQSIYSSVFLSWLEEFPAYSLTHHEQLAKALSSASVKLYTAVREELRPTPLHPHFLFTQHDLSRVVQGMALFSSKSRGRPRHRARGIIGERSKQSEQIHHDTTESTNYKSNSFVGEKEQGRRDSNSTKVRSWPTLIGSERDSGLSLKTPAIISPMIRSLLRLWCHESTRTYSDRLLTEDQRHWFSSQLHQCAEEFFCKDNSELGMEAFKIDADVMQDTLQEITSGTKPPPPSAVDKPSSCKEKDGDDCLVHQGESTFLPSEEQLESSGESELEDDHREISADRNVSQATQGDVEDEDGESPEKGDIDLVESLPKREARFQGNPVEEDNAVVEPCGVTQPPRFKVTFDDRTGASYDKSYRGPLIASEQLAFSGEDLTKILFCKHFGPSVTGRESSESEVASRNYLECAESILEQGVKRWLRSYNELAVANAKSRIINLVTFREALQHVARLSRALATPGGHALLLSHLGYGRRTLARLAAHSACCKIIEIQRSQFQSQEELRQQIKTASFIAGLQGKQVLLFVPEGLDDDSLQDVCSLMAEGTCPGLYTTNELSMISSQLLPGGKRGARRVENQQIAQERFFRRVKSQMHIFVCLKYTPISQSICPDETQLYRFPTLVTRSCCVDVYRGWPHEALVSVAEKVLEEEEDVLSLLPLKKRERDSQAAAICSIMGYVHLSARSMVERCYGVKALKVYSPDTFLDFVDLYRKICKQLCVKAKEEVARLDKAIKRVDEATGSLNKMQRELDQLTPVLEVSKADLQKRQDAVEASQQEYADAKERCKKQEQDIEDMQGPIERLKKQAEEEFEKVSPLFDAALNAINSLDIYDVEEIRSYRTPPDLVRLVVNAICLLFEKEQNWEEGKLLLNRDSFFKDLEFYDMKNMPDIIFFRLQNFYDNPKFRPEVVKDGSVAAKSLCMWARAVYEFCLVQRGLEPKRQELLKAEQELQKAKSFLGEMRVRCNAIKQELESNIQSYKDSIKNSRSVEKQIQNIDVQRANGQELLESLSVFSDSWHTSRKTEKQRLITAPGDSLVTAAAVCYLGPLVPAARDELFTDWLRVCDGMTREPKKRLCSLASVMLGQSRNEHSLDRMTAQPTTPRSSLSGTVVPLRDDFCLEAILASLNELEEWRRRDLPSDEKALQNALIMRSCSNDRSRNWPLLIDPHNQAELWIKALHEDQLVDQFPSRTDARHFDRVSSRLSGRLSTEFEAPSLDYGNLEETALEDREAESRVSGNDDDELLRYLKDNDDQDSSFRDTPATSRTERAVGSNIATSSERLLTQRLADAMRIQVETPSPPGSLGPTPNVGFVEGEILIVPADDPQIVNKLRMAVKKGLITLVTHVERRLWHKSLELLLARHTFSNSEGALQVTIGKVAVDYNPSFRLYLSSSLPLFVPGEGHYPLPFSKTSTIDATISREGVCDMLWVDTLRLEHPEFEGQQRSIVRDISLHKQQIDHAKEFMREKVLKLSGPLLKDNTMLTSVTQNKEMIYVAEERRLEAQTMMAELLTTQSDYLPVAQHGALLFSVISDLHKLHPYYRFPLESFLHLFHNTVAERNRGKKSSGSPAARAAELIAVLCRNVYDRISWSLFQGDNYVFPFLLAVEKMLNSGALSDFEWQLFTRTSNRVHGERPQESAVDKPHWVPQEVWDSLADLELVPAFSGLSQSVAQHSDQWREYFNLPPVLLSATPGDFNHLTVFQKALLWRTFQQDQLFRVCRDIVLYEVGAAMTESIGYQLPKVYSVTTCASPVIFIQPSQNLLSQGKASVLKDPAIDVLNLARAHNKDHPLLRVTLGEPASMERALKAVKRGMSAGSWVILENCHLASKWSEEFMHELETIVSTPVIVNEDEFGQQLVEGSGEAQLYSGELENAVHPEFRLWLISRADNGLHLPAVLIQHGLKLACDAEENFRDMVKTNTRVAGGSLVNCVPMWGQEARHPEFKSDIPPYAIYTLAFLHSVLLQRRSHCESSFGCPYRWSQADILAGLEALRSVSRACSSTLLPAIMERTLGQVTYGGHVTNSLDWNAVSSLAFSVSSNQTAKFKAGDQDIDSCLENVPAVPTSQELGLGDKCITCCHSQLSSDIAQRLRVITGLVPSPPSIEDQVRSVAEQTLKKLLDIKESIKPFETSHDIQTATTSFLLRDRLYFQNLIDKAIKDIGLLLNACSGNASFTPHLFSVASSLVDRRVHVKWISKGNEVDSIDVWLDGVQSCVKALSDYLLPPPLQPSTFNLGAFVHPQAFLASVLMDHARATMKSVYALQFSSQVLHPNTKPCEPPDRGVYLSGLKLSGASWDAARDCVIASCGILDLCDLPIVWLNPVEIVRSRAPSARVDEQDPVIPFYEIPLVNAGVWNGDSASVVSALSLPSAMPGGLLKQRRVSIVPVLR